MSIFRPLIGPDSRASLGHCDRLLNEMINLKLPSEERHSVESISDCVSHQWLGSLEEAHALHALAGAQATVIAAEKAIRISGESMRDVATLIIARLAEDSAKDRLEHLRSSWAAGEKPEP
jgi:hypothetical protein